ncbi:MAG: hypothetical protein KC586_06190, partial [Myxococcales bacterium]|nr:hypothetical protein [Myxococcales bacterium]
MRRLWCWGSNDDGMLGVGDTMRRVEPTPVGAFDDWTTVDAGGAFSFESHTCALRSSGWLYCWGSNTSGQLGLGLSGEDVLTPSRVGVERDWISIAVGGGFTCGVRGTGTLWCWGTNSQGQLGLGASAPSSTSTPTRVGTGTTWVDVTAGSLHACARRTDDSVWCWG